MPSDTISRGFHSPELFKVGFTLWRDMKHFSEKIDNDNGWLLKKYRVDTWKDLEHEGLRLLARKSERRIYHHAGPGWEISIKYIPFTLPGFLRVQNLADRCRVLLPTFQIYPEQPQMVHGDAHNMAVVAYIEITRHREPQPWGSSNATIADEGAQLYICRLP
jgi:hypothetical protein